MATTKVPMSKSVRALRRYVKQMGKSLDARRDMIEALSAEREKQRQEIKDLQKQVGALRGNDIRRVEVVSVVLVRFMRGAGTKEDPIREVLQYWDEQEGELLVEKDENAPTEVTLNCVMNLPEIPEPTKISQLVRNEIAKIRAEKGL